MRASPGHALPPELERSAPRDVGLTAGGRVLNALAWLLAAAALVAGAALHIEARRQADTASDFDRRSVTASAVVDRLWRKTGDGKPAYAAFHFDVNGTRIDSESRMQLSAWRELRTGSTLAVRYLPDNPRQFLLAGQRRSRMPIALPYVVSFALAAIALLCLAPIHWQRRLLGEGRAARAVVTKVKQTKGSHGETHRAMEYQFRALAGTMTTGKAAASKQSEVGTTISVVYDPERPTRNRPYPFSLVTLKKDW
jgi:hypothetical protein